MGRLVDAMDDWSLLQQYVRDGSRTALDELVRRYLPLVYAAAVRQTGDRHLAEDVTQVVFLVLMRRASKLSRSVMLGGWLFKVTAFTAAKMRRGQGRRQTHETQAASMNAGIQQQSTDSLHDDQAGLVHEAVAALPSVYRDAVVMRYMQDKSFAELAQAQQITENTARQRLFRALGKLRKRLSKKGMQASDQTIGSALAVGAMGIPAGLEAQVAAALDSSGATQTISAAADNILRMMIMAKVKTAAIATAIMLAGIGGGLVLLAQSRSEPSASAPPTSAPQVAAEANLPLSPNAVLIGMMDAFLTGDARALANSFGPLNPEQEAALRRTLNGVNAKAGLQLAITRKFGEEPARNLIQTIGIDPPPAIRDVIMSAPVVFNGDTATLDLPRTPISKVRLVRINGAWKLAGDMTGEPFFSMLGLAAAPLTQIMTNVESGVYTDTQQVAQDIRKAMTELRNASATRPVAR